MNIRDVAKYALGPICTALFTFATLPLLSWIYSSSDVGKFALLQISLALGISFFSMAMHQSYVREYYAYNNKDSLFKTSIIPGFLLLSFFTIISLSFLLDYLMVLFGVNEIVVIFLFFTLWLLFINNMFMHVLRMENKILIYSICQFLPKSILLFLIVISSYFPHERVIDELVIFNFFAVLITFFLLIFYCFRLVSSFNSISIDIQLMARMTKFSIPLTIGGLAYWGLSSVDRFMIRTFLGFDDLGLYSISVTFASYVVVITSVFSNIWHPTVYKWIDDGVNIDKISQVVKLSSFSICLLWCLSGVFSWIIPLVLPTDYSRVVYLFPVAVGGPLLYLLSETTVVGINISKKTVYSMIASITAVLSTAGLCYFLLPKVGVVGAAISSCLAYFLCFVMRSEFSMSLWIHLPIRRVYLAVTYLIFTSASIAIYEPDLKIIIAIWFASLIIITLFFWKEVIFIRKSLKVKLC